MDLKIEIRITRKDGFQTIAEESMASSVIAATPDKRKYLFQRLKAVAFEVTEKSMEKFFPPENV